MKRAAFLLALTSLALLGACDPTSKAEQKTEANPKTAQPSAPEELNGEKTRNEHGILLNTRYSTGNSSGTEIRYVFSGDTVTVTQKQGEVAGQRVEIFKDDKGYFGAAFVRSEDGLLLFGPATAYNQPADAWQRLVGLGLTDVDGQIKPVDEAELDKIAATAPEGGYWTLLADAPVTYEDGKLTIDWGQCTEGTVGYAWSCTPDPETWEILDEGYSLKSASDQTVLTTSSVF